MKSIHTLVSITDSVLLRVSATKLTCLMKLYIYIWEGWCLNILCHSYRFAWQQSLLKSFPGLYCRGFKDRVVWQHGKSTHTHTHTHTDIYISRVGLEISSRRIGFVRVMILSYAIIVFQVLLNKWKSKFMMKTNKPVLYEQCLKLSGTTTSKTRFSKLGYKSIVSYNDSLEWEN